MFLDKIFHLKENNTRVSTEILAGFTTFFAMVYILMVNSNIMGGIGMPIGAIYLGTVIVTVIGGIALGLFANVPLAQSAGLGLTTFFAYTIVLTLGFTWQEALSISFICGIVIVILTVTKLRVYIVRSVPKELQAAIGCGIGLYTAYVGMRSVNLINLINTSWTLPEVNWAALSTSPALWLFLIGCLILIVSVLMKVKGALLICIAATTLIGLIPFFGVTSLAESISIADAFSQFPEVFGAVFTPAGLPSLFADPMRIPIVVIMIISFSLISMFDNFGITLAAASRVGHKMNPSRDSRFKRTLITSAAGLTVGSVFGISNSTVYVESISGIEAGGRTGLTAIVTALCFAACIFLIPVATVVPNAATAPVLIFIGLLMMKPLGEIEWKKLDVAIPCFFTTVFMCLCSSITDGIAAGFLSYCFIKLLQRDVKNVYPLVWVVGLLFVTYAAARVLLGTGGG